MPAAKKPKKTTTAPELVVELELDDVFSWRLDRLEEAGIEHHAAFRLAWTAVDWHLIARTKAAGATDRQLLDLFLDDWEVE